MKKRVKINEATLRKIVAESVKRVLKEDSGLKLNEYFFMDKEDGDDEADPDYVPAGIPEVEEARKKTLDGTASDRDVALYLNNVYNDIVKPGNIDAWEHYKLDKDLEKLEALDAHEGPIAMATETLRTYKAKLMYGKDGVYEGRKTKKSRKKTLKEDANIDDINTMADRAREAAKAAASTPMSTIDPDYNDEYDDEEVEEACFNAKICVSREDGGKVSREEADKEIQGMLDDYYDLNKHSDHLLYFNIKLL